MKMRELLMIIIGSISQFLFILKVKKKDYLKATIFKSIASLSFVLIAFLNINDNSSIILSFGLLFGLLGDVVLEIRHLIKHYNEAFITGTMLFFIEHLLLLQYFISSCHKFNDFNIIFGIIIFIFLAIYLYKHTKAIRIFTYVGSLYVAMLSIMLTFSINTYINLFTTSSLLIMIGGILFVISDSLLIIYNFGKKNIKIHIVSLIIYFLAQTLLATSIL